MEKTTRRPSDQGLPPHPGHGQGAGDAGENQTRPRLFIEAEEARREALAKLDESNAKVGGPLVNARDLHKVGKDFSTWITGRIKSAGFVEDGDFTVVNALSSPISGSSKSRPQVIKEYPVTLDMAEELAMLEKTKLGRAARQYFIACEKQLRAALKTAIWRTTAERHFVISRNLVSHSGHADCSNPRYH